ncbi:MAG: hypothetical protein P1V97_00330 [Planctomycetota bacterium]|nr:hypothetical protein [Planctomycetota bacterium]
MAFRTQTMIFKGLVAGLFLGLLNPTASFAQGATSRPSSRPASQPAKKTNAFADAVEKAHNGKVWKEKGAFQFDIKLNRKGKDLFTATVTMETCGARSRMDIKNGPTLVFDGKKAWVASKTGDFPRARFHLLTWTYFMAAPFKLQDPGSALAKTSDQKLHGKLLNTARLTFDKGVGDSPEDWYVVYKDPSKNELAALAYIVTYGKSKEKATKAPHILTYEDPIKVDGVTLTKRWRIYDWSAKKGAYGEAIYDITLSKHRFVDLKKVKFEKPAGAKEDKLPGSK